MRRVRIILLVLVAVLLGAFFLLRVVFGGGRYAIDLTTPPRFSGDALEIVANLGHPPGNIAVSAEGRVFFTLHPEASPPVQLVELVRGEPVPWPNAAIQEEAEGRLGFQSLLSVRIDRQGRLWALDYANHGRGQPRLLAFDLATGELVHRHDFPSEVAGFLSMLNDFQVDPEGKTIFIADTGLFSRQPALVVYDVERKTSRRVLDRHPSVMPEDYILSVQGRDMVFFGFYALRIGIDSIALDRDGEWLYYGPVNHDRLFRIRADDLADPALSDAELGRRVEDFARKPLSDGLSTDSAGNVYLTDPDHSAILMLTPEKKLRTLVRDDRLRWPDGLSFGPDGWLYVTASALHHVILRSDEHRRSRAPFQVYRFRPGPDAPAGH